MSILANSLHNSASMHFSCTRCHNPQSKPLYVNNHPSNQTTPHPTVILTTRFIRHYEDSTIALLKASNDYDMPRNIAYLHAIHRLIVIDKLKKPLWIKHKTATPAMHAILMKSNYNHNKHLIMQHVPRKIIEKLPRVVLT
jgi:hypothetical protein